MTVLAGAEGTRDGATLAITPAGEQASLQSAVSARAAAAATLTATRVDPDAFGGADEGANRG
ncbi:MAG: hypothetical protein ACLPN6_06910 [Streptosporangiaceae bacterium]